MEKNYVDREHSARIFTFLRMEVEEVLEGLVRRGGKTIGKDEMIVISFGIGVEDVLE